MDSKYDKDPHSVHLIEFNVAVVATDGKETGGGVGLKVLGAVDLGAKGASSSKQSTESRLKFSIPVALPRSEPVPKSTVR
jgi:hypothetical protein